MSNFCILNISCYNYKIIGLNDPGVLYESLCKTGFLHFAFTTPESFSFYTAAQIIPPLCLPQVCVRVKEFVGNLLEYFSGSVKLATNPFPG